MEIDAQKQPWDWRAGELAPTAWRQTLTSDEIDSLDETLAAARRIGLRELAAVDVPLAALSNALTAVADALTSGVGFFVLEGIPTRRYTTEDLRLLFWTIALRLGTPVSQSFRGDVIGDVRDFGTGISGKLGRGYTSNQPLNFHSDAADVTGLFYLRNAKAGGLNGVASSLAVHNEIERRRPDLLEVLHQPFCWSWQGNQPPGAPAYYRMPVFDRAGDNLACAYVRTNILRAEANAGAPPMTKSQIEAVELFAAVAAEPEFALTATFEPGSLFFTNNHRVLHMRTAFEDWPEPERKRHLLRVWLSMAGTQELPASFAAFFSDVRGGAVRGGYQSRAGAPVFETVVG